MNTKLCKIKTAENAQGRGREPQENAGKVKGKKNMVKNDWLTKTQKTRLKTSRKFLSIFLIIKTPAPPARNFLQLLILPITYHAGA